MKTKNLTAKIAGLIILLVAVVGVLVIWTNYTVKQNVVACFVARTDVDSYTVITNTNFNEYFEETTVHKTTYEKLKNPVSSKDEIIGYETITKIAQGYPLDKTLFQKTTNAKYEGIENPVIQSFTISNGDELEMTKGMSVTVVGYMASTDSVLNTNGESVNDSWIGVLTNNALVYDFSYDKNGKLIDVTLIIEEKVYTKVTLFSINYNLYLVSGKIDDVSNAKSDVVRELYLKSGSNSDIGFAMTNVDLRFDVAEVTNNQPTYFATGTDTNYKGERTKQNLTYVKLVNNVLPELTWSGATPSVFVYHYALDGTRGARYGNYSKSSNNPKFELAYDGVFNEYSFRTPLADEGFYQIIFDVKNPNYGREYINAEGLVVAEPYYLHYCINFVIETSEKPFAQTPSIVVDMYNENNLYTSLSSTKNYFSKIALMEGYTETFDIENTDEMTLRIVKYYDMLNQTTVQIPYFNKNTDATKGLTPSDEQYNELMGLFGKGQDETSNFLTEEMVNNIFKTTDGSSKYSKEEIQFIIDTLREYSNDNFANYDTEAKYLVLESLGFSLNTTVSNQIITSILTPYKIDDTTPPVYSELVIYYKNGVTLTLKLDVNGHNGRTLESTNN